MQLNIIYTLEVQDGENRYSQHSPQTIEVENSKDIEGINREGEKLARTYISEVAEDEEADAGDWYEIEGGCRAIRYKSFDIIEDAKTFDIIKNICYK